VIALWSTPQGRDDKSQKRRATRDANARKIHDPPPLHGTICDHF
jgi:hypothetical protein